jgi:PTS system fructose-specific IIA component/PTS system nitrogen regulatory IIA component
MNLTEFVVREAVIPNLESGDRNGVIRELVAAVARAGAIDDTDKDVIAKSIIQRENQGSTGFGKGVAVPHVKHPKVKKIMAAIGRSATGIDFSALDRSPVYTVVLLMSPQDNPDGHLQAMESIFRHLQRDSFRKFLRQADTVDAILDLIKEADEHPSE